MLVESLQALLGHLPEQFGPFEYLVASWFLLLLVAYFAEFLKHLVMRW